MNCTPTTPTSSDAVAASVTLVPDTVVPFAGAVTLTVGAVVSALLTVTVTVAAVVVFPAASRATAVNVWVPLVALVVSQVLVYGAAASSEPQFTPSNLNCTPATPMLSDAVAEMVTAGPDMVAPFAGAVSETVGGVVSAAVSVVKTTSTQ